MISINYTSGTTGRPKGVMYTHRGAYLNALGEIIVHGLARDSVFLWTLPLFHCNGWCFPWAVTAVGGTHVMLRSVEPAEVLPLIRTEGVTHSDGAPTVLLMLGRGSRGAGAAFRAGADASPSGGAPPSPTLLADAWSSWACGSRISTASPRPTGRTPSASCSRAGTRSDVEGRATRLARQGVPT